MKSSMKPALTTCQWYLSGTVVYYAPSLCPSQIAWCISFTSTRASGQIMHVEQSISTWLYVSSAMVCYIQDTSQIKVVGSCLESRRHNNACSTDFPLARWAPMQPATIDPTLDLCTRYPLWLGGPRQCGIRSFARHFHTPNTGNRTPDLLILSLMPYPLGHMLPLIDFTSTGLHWE